jgi:hypothetical protein
MFPESSDSRFPLFLITTMLLCPENCYSTSWFAAVYNKFGRGGGGCCVSSPEHPVHLTPAFLHVCLLSFLNLPLLPVRFLGWACAGCETSLPLWGTNSGPYGILTLSERLLIFVLTLCWSHTGACDPLPPHFTLWGGLFAPAVEASSPSLWFFTEPSHCSLHVQTTLPVAQDLSILSLSLSIYLSFHSPYHTLKTFDHSHGEGLIVRNSGHR